MIYLSKSTKTTLSVIALSSDLECGAESVLKILLPHQPDVGLHGLGGDGVGSESKTRVFVARDLLSQ